MVNILQNQNFHHCRVRSHHAVCRCGLDGKVNSGQARMGIVVIIKLEAGKDGRCYLEQQGGP